MCTMWLISFGMSTDFGAPHPENSNRVKSEKKLSTASVDIAQVL